MKSFYERAVTLASWLALAGLSFGQALVWDRSSAPALNNQFGVKVWPLSDVDGDQISDLLVGMPGYLSYVGVLSGATGNSIVDYFAPPQQGLKPIGPVGDVNGDGAIDFLITYLPTGSSFAVTDLISGANATVLGSLPWGLPYYSQCSSIGDINGDGLGDFTITMPQLSGWIEVYLGPGFNLAYAVGAQVADSAFGTSVAPCGDINTDGVPDFIVGAPGANGLPPVPGYAYVLSGVDGVVIRNWAGPFLYSRFGASVVSPGDVDGDGVSDIVVSAPFTPPQSLTVFSGATGSQVGLYMEPVPLNNGFGWNLVALGDVDGDAVGDYACRGSWVDVFSGLTATPIYKIPTNLPFGFPSGYNVGASLAPSGDFDGDTFPNIIIGAPAYSPSSGHIQCYTLRPHGVAVVGNGCAQASGAFARIGATGVPQANATFKINLSNVPVSVGAGLVVGLSNTQFGFVALPWQVDPILAPGCFLQESIDWFVMSGTTAASPGMGRATQPLFIPPGLTGLTFYTQWGVENLPGSVALGSLTRSFAVTIQ